MKRCVGVLIWVVLLISFSSANSHNASNIYLKINGADTNLQTAISLGNFSSSYTGGSYSLPIISGHNASEIIVNVNGTIKSFAVSISDGTLNSTLAGSSPAVYTGYNMIFGEYGTNINIVNRSGVQKSLQTAINDGEFRACVDIVWAPINNPGCYSDTFIQTSNCGTTRQATQSVLYTKTFPYSPYPTGASGDTLCASLGRECIFAFAGRQWCNYQFRGDEYEVWKGGGDVICSCIDGREYSWSGDTETGGSYCARQGRSCIIAFDSVGVTHPCSVDEDNPNYPVSHATGSALCSLNPVGTFVSWTTISIGYTKCSAIGRSCLAGYSSNGNFISGYNRWSCTWDASNSGALCI